MRNSGLAPSVPAVRTFTRSTDLPVDADRVWALMLLPSTFLYVTRGLLGFPSLAGRTEPMHEGETGTGWLLLFHVVPFSRHTIHVLSIDADTRTIRTREHGGVLRRWDHTLQVDPLGSGGCRYRDSVAIDAGFLTPLVAVVARGIFRYRQHRWHSLVASTR